MYTDLSSLLELLILLTISLGLPFIIVELYLLLKRLNSTIQKVDDIADRFSEIADSDEGLKDFTKEIVSYSANEIINNQSQRLLNGLLSGISHLFIKK